nr:NADH dehydrogenase subunit 4L [Lepidoglyphus destructor]
MLGLMVGCMVFLILLYSSSHFLIVLLVVEFMVLLVFFSFLLLSGSWFMSLMFLLVGVCMGAYGVCLLVSSSRSKGGLHLMSFSM